MNRTKVTGVFAVFVAGLLGVGVVAAGNIEGSAHDFSDGLDRFGQVGGDAWSSQTGGGEICIVCHAPHNNVQPTGELAWNRAMSSATFVPYDSPTMNGAAAINGQTLLCLSCHDGTIALDSYGGGSSNTDDINNVDPDLEVGPNMGQDHPVGNVYADATSTTDPTLALASKAVTVGEGADAVTGTITSLLLSGTGTVECGSCHDPHNTLTIDTAPAAPDTSNRLLKVSNVGSALCLTCHEK